MPDITTTVNGVAKQLSKLNSAKTVGPDGLTSRILKELRAEIGVSVFLGPNHLDHWTLDRSK